MWGTLVFADLDWKRKLAEAGLGTCAALRACPACGPPAAVSRTSITEPIDVDGLRLHRKIYRYPSRRDRIRTALRGTLLGPPRAVREWRALRALRGAGAPAVEPVAVGVERRFGWVRSTVLVTRSVEGARSLDRILAEPADVRAALTRLARVIALAHAAGHVLGRPALRDILVVGDRSEIHLLDLPRHRRVRVVREADVADDLSRLAAGLTGRIALRECLRALSAYRRGRGSGAPDRRALASGVDRAVRRHLERERTRGPGPG